MNFRKILALTLGFMAVGPVAASGPYDYERYPAAVYAEELGLNLNSASVMVFDQDSGKTLLAKNPRIQTPIASITKLMTAVVTLDAQTPLDERISITKQDIDRLKGTGSRLAIGATYTREQLLNLALIASENRAAHALGRTYPGGLERFIEAMNSKARELGMSRTFLVDPTGLSSFNQSTAEDLVKLVNHAYSYYPTIREISSSGQYSLGKQRVVVRKSKKKQHASRRVYYRNVAFANTNRLTRDDEWHVGLSKTGYINEAGHCLVMQAEIAERRVIIVLLDAVGKYNRLGDANRIKHWLEESINSHEPQLSATISRDT